MKIRKRGIFAVVLGLVLSVFGIFNPKVHDFVSDVVNYNNAFDEDNLHYVIQNTFEVVTNEY